MDRSNLISQTEKQFIIDGIDMDIRNDGRRRLDMRDYTMETGLFPYCSGSSRVKCRIEGTEVTVGIKVEVDDSLLDDEVADEDQLDNDKGRIICNVQCTPSASIEFLGKGADALNLNLSRALQRSLCHDGVLDWNSLTITGKSIWIIKLDAIVLQIGGNLEDVLSIAARAALFNTKFPKVEINDLGDGQVDFEPVVDEQDLQCLDISNVPIALTLHRVGERYIVDATIQESLCASSKLIVSINAKGNVVSIQKCGLGSIHPSVMTDMIQTAKEKVVALIREQNNILNEEESVGSENRQPLSFFESTI